MLRYLDFTLVLVVIASSAMASAPCFCAEPGGAVEAVEAPAEEDAGCCPGSEEEAPAAPEHDCPHCATGLCDELAATDPLDVPAIAVVASLSVPPFTVQHVWGAQVAPVVVDARPLEPRVAVDRAVPAAHGRDTYALTRVIRR